MDEVNPSITEVKLKACIVAIYVTGFVISPQFPVQGNKVHLWLLNLGYNRKPAN